MSVLGVRSAQRESVNEKTLPCQPRGRRTKTPEGGATGVRRYLSFIAGPTHTVAVGGGYLDRVSLFIIYY